MFTPLLFPFREGLETFLMIAVATLFLRKTDRPMLIRAVSMGLAPTRSLIGAHFADQSKARAVPG